MYEMVCMVCMGYWLVLPYSDVRGMTHLKIAPAGVVPQHDHHPHPIIDHTYNGVNTATLNVTPTHSLQFGSSLQCILQHLAYCNPAFGPSLMAKVDLAGGYYRIPLSTTTSLELTVVLPPDGGQEPLIGLPLSLPMGWTASPPYFCAFTETCTDLCNHHPTPISIHPFSYASQQYEPLAIDLPCSPDTVFPFNSTPPSTPLQYTDVYIDNFMLLVQKPTQLSTMANLLHHLNSIFQDPVKSPRRSIKVAKGNATFSTIKRIMGWDIHSHNLKICLPQHRVHCLRTLLENFLSKNLTTRKHMQWLLEELRGVTLSLHSSHMLFSVLQHKLHNEARLMCITSLEKRALHDWYAIIQDMEQHPVPNYNSSATHPTLRWYYRRLG